MAIARVRRAILAAIAAGFVVIGPAAAPHAQAKRPMTLVDLLNIPRVLDPQISPDGRRISFMLQTTDWPNKRRISQIWEVGADGRGLHQLTRGDSSAISARWAPDGSTLAYLSRGNISLIAPGGDSPAVRELSHHATPVSAAAGFAWSLDGRAIYFVADDPPSEAERQRRLLRGDTKVLDEFAQRHLWKITLDGREERLTSGDFSITGFSVARDGSLMVVRAPGPNAPEADLREVWRMKSDGSAPVQLTHNKIEEGDPFLSPDGTQVLFLARANDRQEPYYNANPFLMPVRGGTPHPLLPDFSYEVLSANWSADGKSIWMSVNMGVHIEVFHVDVATRVARQVTSGDHAIQQRSMMGDHQVFLIDEQTRIGDIWVLPPGATMPTRITNVYEYLDRDFALPRQERVQWKGADGVAVEGILTYPIDYKPGTRYPLVVQLHGGPDDSDRFGWGLVYLNYQPAWAAKGYAILRPNYRGSSGYGSAFYREPVGGYFKQSHLDVLAGVDKVIAMGVADGDRLSVMGWSAGGHLVNKLITFTSRFKAASSYAGVANWISLYGETDRRGAIRDLWLGGGLWQKNAPVENYWDHSPLKYVSAARTPTVFLIGEEDPRVPLAQSVEMSRALKAQGVPTEVDIVPGEGHTWARPDHQLYKMNREMEWFATYTLKRPYTFEPTPTTNDTSLVPASH
jgi:dipeptidyl aminopeptidase/acylaminoacyl peptidase